MSAMKIKLMYVAQKIIAQACTSGRSRVWTASTINFARPG